MPIPRAAVYTGLSLTLLLTLLMGDGALLTSEIEEV